MINRMAKGSYPSSYPITRTLAPLLIIAIPIAAMIAWLLLHTKAEMTAEQPAAAPSATQAPTASFGGESWPVFRGDPALTGTAAGNLPEKLKLAWKFQAESQILSLIHI